MSATDRDVSQLSYYDDDTVRTASSRATSVSSLPRSNARHSRASRAPSNSSARRSETQADAKSPRKHRTKRHRRKAEVEAATPAPETPLPVHRRGRISSRASSRRSMRRSNSGSRTPVGSRASLRTASPAASRGSPQRVKHTVRRTVNVTTSAPMRNVMSMRRQEMAAANYWMQEQQRREAAAYSGVMPFAYQTVDQYNPFPFGCAMASSVSPPYLPNVLPQHSYAMAPQPFRQGTLTLTSLPSPIMAPTMFTGQPHSHLVLPTINAYGGLTYGSLPPIALPTRKSRLERQRSSSGRRSHAASPTQQYHRRVTEREKSLKRRSSERGELKTTTKKKTSSVQKVTVRARGDTVVKDSSITLKKKKKKVRRGTANQARPHSPRSRASSRSPRSQRSSRSPQSHRSPPSQRSPRSAQRRSATPSVAALKSSNEQASLKAVAVQTKPRTPSPSTLRKPPSRQGSPIGVVGRVDASVSPRASTSSTQEGSRSPSSVRFRSAPEGSDAAAAARRRSTPIHRQAAVQTARLRSPPEGAEAAPAAGRRSTPIQRQAAVQTARFRSPPEGAEAAPEAGRSSTPIQCQAAVQTARFRSPPEGAEAAPEAERRSTPTQRQAAVQTSRFRSPPEGAEAAPGAGHCSTPIQRRSTPIQHQAAVQTALPTRSPASGVVSDVARVQRTSLALRTPPLGSESPTVRASAGSMRGSGRTPTQTRDQQELLVDFTRALSTSGNSDLLTEVKRYYADLLVDFSSAVNERSSYWKELMLYQTAVSWLKIAQLWAYGKLLNGRNDALANVFISPDLKMNPQLHDSLSQLKTRACGLLTAPFGGFVESTLSIGPPADLRLVDHHLGVIAVAVVEFVVSKPKAATCTVPSVLPRSLRPPEIWNEITPTETGQIMAFAWRLYDIACECLGVSRATVHETPKVMDRGKWAVYKSYMAVQLALRARVLLTHGKTFGNCTTLNLASVFTPDLLREDPLHWIVRDFDRIIRECFVGGQCVSLDCANVILPRPDAVNDLNRLAVDVLRMCKPQ